MKKELFLFFAVVSLCFTAFAQSELTYKSEVFQNGIFQNGTKLKAYQVRKVMEENNEALALYNSGRPMFVMGQVIAYPCAFLLGFDLGTRLGGGEGNGTLLVIGATGTVAGLIIGLIGESKIKTSVSLYNSKANENTASCQVDFGLTPTGVGICMRF